MFSLAEPGALGKGSRLCPPIGFALSKIFCGYTPKSYLALSEVGANETGAFFAIFWPPEQFFVALIAFSAAYF